MEILRLHPECISCLLKKQLDNFPEGTSPEKKLLCLQKILGMIAEAPPSTSAPVLVRSIDRIRTELFGAPQDYTEVKRHFNNVMLRKETAVDEKICRAKDPLLLALQYAMSGNYIDFGAMQNVDEEKLDALLDNSCTIPVKEEAYQALRRDLLAAKRIVYLTDNCGEIVMDKLLMKEIRRQNPDAELTAIVRGAPVLNDATLEDAQQIWLSDAARVMDNGSDIAGTCLEEISAEALHVIDSADVILAKGQANFETLRGCGRNVHYLFLCKCSLFAGRFGVPQFTGMLIHDKDS